MSIKEQLQWLVDKMNQAPEHLQNEKNRVFQIDLHEGQSFQMILKDGVVSFTENGNEPAEITLKLSEENFSKLLKGELNATMAFMMGQIKVEGQLGLAMKLQEILKKYGA